MINIHAVYGFFMRRFRPARMAAIRNRFPLLSEGGTVIDLGGTAQWWREMGVGTTNITIVNLDDRHKLSVEACGYAFLQANACALPCADMSFDLAFSNSVIEHVGGWPEQQAFAREIMRCGRRFYLQTPNKWFPVEPHLMTLGIHWLPLVWQTRLVRHLSLWGWIAKPDRATISSTLAGIRLLSESEIRSLFPGCEVQCEKVLGLTKSFIVFRG